MSFALISLFFIYFREHLAATTGTSADEALSICTFAHDTTVASKYPEYSCDPFTLELSAYNYCSFTGIECTEDGSIVAIDLSVPIESTELKLSGPIRGLALPENLPNLEYLNLRNNEFDGIFSGPCDECNSDFFENLKYVDLSNNLIYEEFDRPYFLSHKLVELYLHNNLLHGTLNPSMGDLSLLQYLSLSGNLFSGKFPPGYERENASSYGFVSLIAADISHNLFDDFNDQIRVMNQLVHFDMSFNAFTAFPDLRNHSDLEVLFVNNNVLLTLEDPDILNALPALTHFDMSSNPGPLPDLSAARNLRYLGVEGVASIDRFPEHVLLLSNLEELHCGRNSISGSIPVDLFLLTKLTTLDMQSSMLSSNIPTEIYSLTKLTVLNLQYNILTGPVPEILCEIQSLVEVHLEYNNFECVPLCLHNSELGHQDVQYCPGAQDSTMCALAVEFDIPSTTLTQVSEHMYQTVHPRFALGIGREEYFFNASARNEKFFDRFEIYVHGLTDFDKGTELIICTSLPCDLGNYHLYYNSSGSMARPSEHYPIIIRSPNLYFVVPAVKVTAPSSNWISYGVTIFVKSFDRELGGGWLCTEYGIATGRPTSIYASSMYAAGLCRDWTGVSCDRGLVKSINLHGYGISATLPIVLVNLERLEELDLSFNNFFGTIPEELFYMKYLRILDLSANRLNGNVTISFIAPAPMRRVSRKLSLPRNTRLFEVNLAYNGLVGTLPTNLLTLTGLQSLYLQGNKFHGPVSDQFCDRSNDSSGLKISLFPGDRICFSDCWVELYPSDAGCDTPAPTLTPTHSPTMSPSMSPPPSRSPTAVPSSLRGNVNSTQITNNDSDSLPQYVIVVTVIMSFVGCCILLSCVYLIVRKYPSRIGIDNDERKERLLNLPIHSVLYNGAKKDDLEKAVKHYLKTAKEYDYDGRTAVDIILSFKVVPRSVTPQILTRLVEDCLPFDKTSGTPIKDPKVHVYAWSSLMQHLDPVCSEVVEILSSKYIAHAERLAYFEDSLGRRCIDIATKQNKEILVRKLYLDERYELFSGQPVHMSQNCIVRFAYDHSNPAQVKEKTKVAMKFMKYRTNYIAEIKSRDFDFDDQYVITILVCYDCDDESQKRFRDHAIIKGYKDYPYCIVMEAGEQSLQGYIVSQSIYNDKWDDIRYFLKSLVLCIQHIHNKGLIHGDLKPMNILVVEKAANLLDFDASAKVDLEFAGAKYSSAYLPPEMFHRCPNGEIIVKEYLRDESSGQPVQSMSYPYELVKAHPSLDIWSLGCILFLMCTGTTMFLSSIDGHISENSDVQAIWGWTEETKKSKLDRVKNKFAKNLLSLLLDKDPIRRLAPDRILTHPFLTGVSPVRMQGDIPEFDVFISYRVDSDADLANLLYDALTKCELNVWLDSLCLPPGINWEQGFCKGLVNSAFVVCILSREGINSSSATRRNVTELSKASACDNLLLEWRLAVELKERGMINGIYPVMRGDKNIDSDPNDPSYTDYFRSGCNPNPVGDVVVDTLESKLREHLNREGLGSPFADSITIKSLLSEITSNQGGFIRGKFSDSFSFVVSSITKMCHKINSESTSAKLIDSSSIGINKMAVTDYKAVLEEKLLLLEEKELALRQKEEVIEHLTKILKSAKLGPIITNS